MMRIALLSVHTSPLAPPGGKKVGGMNTYVREISQALAEQGIEVDIFTRRISPQQPAVDYALGNGVRVIHITAGPVQPMGTDDIYPYSQQFAAGVIAHAIRHNLRYDLIFSHYWLSGVVAQKLKENWNIPFVQMFHTLGHMKARIPSVSGPIPSTRIQVETQLVNKADHLIANTPAERAQLLWLYRADRRKISICPPGVNPAHFRPTSRQQAREQLGIPQDQDLLMFVGRIEPLKAVDSIIEALGIIHSNQPGTLHKTRFAIIGGDPKDPTDKDINALKALSQQLGLNHVVDFLGAKDQTQLVNYYAAASTVIMPSEYESFGMVALEAMATGTPVIASEVGGLAYLVKHGETGFLVPSRDPESLAEYITRLITNPDLRETLGKNAADRARAYAWSAITDELLDIFRPLVKQPTQQKIG